MKKRHPKRYHLTLDVIDVNQSYLDNENFLKTVLREISKLIEMKIIYGPVILKGCKENPGLSAFCIIDYSHISIHTFIKDKEFCLDVFSCKPFNYSTVKKYLIKKLSLKKEQIFKSVLKYDKNQEIAKIFYEIADFLEMDGRQKDLRF